MRRVGIIGFAGGHVPENAPPLDASLFVSMQQRARAVIIEQFKLSIDNVHFVSGGAAWADHVAVALFLENAPCATKLTIAAPCKIDAETGRFFDNGFGTFWRDNPGYYANKLHTQFNTACGGNSFDQLKTAMERGATIDTSKPGFHQRNTLIAESIDYLIAFSWTRGAKPTEGGTKDTWDKARRHLDPEHMMHISAWDLVKRPNDEEESVDPKRIRRDE